MVKKLRVRLVLSLLAVLVAVILFSVLSMNFQAMNTLNLTAGAATVLWYALQGGALAIQVASLVSSMGLGVLMTAGIAAVARRWALKKFLAW